MHQLWMATAFLVTILTPALWFGMSQSTKTKNDISSGPDEARAKRLWDRTPSHQRDLMLAAISIFDGACRDTLLPKQWTHLPIEVRSALAKTLAGVRTDGEMYIGYLDDANPLVSITSEAPSNAPALPSSLAGRETEDRVLVEAA